MISKAPTSQIVSTTEAEIRAFNVLRTAVRTVRNPLIAFSGGKDSIVLAHLCYRFGLRKAVRDNSLTFYRVERQVNSMVVPALRIELDNVDPFGRDWIFKEPSRRKWLWPELKEQAKFYRIAQQTTVAKYAETYGYDGVLFGRRKQENCVPSQMYRLRNGNWQVMPLADWTLEEVWSYIRKYSLPYPDIYDREIGSVDGSTRWNLLTPSKYDLPPMELIRDYCQPTYREIVRFAPELAVKER